MSSLCKIINNLDKEKNNLSLYSNPLEKKITEIMRIEKNASEDEINKKFHNYNKEVFQFTKKKYTDQTPESSLKKILTSPKPPNERNSVVPSNEKKIEEKKVEEKTENSFKDQSLSKQILGDTPVNNFQLGFNLFEVKNYDRNKFTSNNNNNPNSLTSSEHFMHKTNSQSDFLSLKNNYSVSYSYKALNNKEAPSKQKIHSHFR